MSGQPIRVRFLRLSHAADLDPPAYQSAGAAGLDLICALPPFEPLTIMPGARALIPTGFSMELPEGFEAQVRPRSGLALKNGVTVLNAPGTIDCDYRGEIKALLVNLGDAPWKAERGARIAQLVIAPVTHVKIELVSSLTNTDRGAGGFGSTGTNVSSEPQRR